MRARYFSVREREEYLPASNAFCTSSIVISSSSKSGTVAVAVEAYAGADVTTRADPSAGYAAAATVAVAPARRKLRREVFFGVSGAMDIATPRKRDDFD